MHTLTTKRLEGSARVGDAPTAPNSSSMNGGRRWRNCSMPTIPGFPGNGTRPSSRGGRGGASCVLGCSRGGPGRRLFDVNGSLGFGRVREVIPRGEAREKGARGERESRGGVGPALIHARGTLGSAETHRGRPAAMASVATVTERKTTVSILLRAPWLFCLYFVEVLFPFNFCFYI